MIELKHLMSTKSASIRCKMKGEEGFTVCGHCVSCRFTAKLTDSTKWLSRAGDATKRTFLTGLLARCRSVPVLESIRGVLQVTFGKDFTYSRSKSPSLAEDVVTHSSNRALDRKVISAEMAETMNWFSCSDDWIKSNYLLSVLSLCDTGLLHMLANLNDVLLAREQRACLGQNAKEVASIPESASSFCSEDRPHLDLLKQASALFEPLDLCEDRRDSKRAARLTSALTNSKGAWLRKEKPPEGRGSEGEDPAFRVVPCSSASLSGVGQHRDFLRCLPVHLAKRILGLLDKITLRGCRDVTQHWRYLADDLALDHNAKKVVRNQVMVMQSHREKKVLSDVYANVLQVPVPVDAAEDGQGPSEGQKGELFGGAYSDVTTKAVQMEERNVYCGLFSVRTLLDREDPHRAVHYGGGPLVAVGSRDRAVRLLAAASRTEVAPALTGHVGSVRTVLLCEDRHLVVSAGYDLSIRCWSIKTRVCVALLNGHTGTINCLDAHSDRLVSGAKDCRVKVWSLQKGKCLEHLRWKHGGSVLCVKVTSSLVHSSCARGLVKIWDMENASLLRVLDGHRSSVKCLFFDQWHLLTGDAEGLVKAWSTHRDASRCLMTFTHPTEVVSLTLAFLRVVTGCVDGKLRVFCLLSGDCLRVIKAGSSPILSVHFHGNNVLVNTTTSVQLFQFVKVDWEYPSAAGPRPAGAPAPWGAPVAPVAPPGPAPGRIPHAFVRGERAAPVGSPCRGVYGPDGEGAERLSHHARCLSAARMRRARESRQESRQESLLCTRSEPDLQPEVRTQPGTSPGRPAGCWGTQRAWTHTHTSNAKQFVEPAQPHPSVSGSEWAAAQRVKRRGPRPRLTAGRVLLRVNAIQRAQGGGEAALNMERNTGLREAWGPPPPCPPPPCPPPPCPPPPCPPPPCPPPCSRTPPEPAVRPPRVPGQHNHQAPGRDDGENAFRARAQSDVGARRRHGHHFLASQSQAPRPAATTAASERTASRTALKDPDRRVNFQTGPGADQLRERGGFRLLTDDQLRRYITLTRALNPGKSERSADPRRPPVQKARVADETPRLSSTDGGRWKH